MKSLVDRHRDLIGQLVRFTLTGGFAAFVNVAVYWLGVVPLRLDPNLAWTIGFLAAVAVGYVAHGRWSFRGHAATGGHARIGTRFFAVALVGYAFNSFWVWLLATRLAFPAWSPIPFAIFVTPLLTFHLNRRWVFAS